MQPADDYRASHLKRGGHYDSLLATVPFDAYMADWEKQHLDSIVKRLFPDGVPRYLDFACGTGRATATVASLAHQSTGVDISPSMLQVAGQKLPSVQFVQADLTNEDPDLGQFDLITSFRFFGNAQDELREGVMRALRKRMAPGGYFIVNSHRNPRALYAILDRLTGGDAGKMDLHLGKLKALLARHGLVVRRQIPIGAWMFRSGMLDAFQADDPIAMAREQRFSHPAWTAWAPDAVIVAQAA